jgi:hypothetical protein
VTARIALAAALLGGCGAPRPIAVHVADERETPAEVEHDAWGPLLPEAVLEACAALDLDCYRTETTERWGVVRLRLVDDAGEGISGKTEGRGWCRKAARVEVRPLTIAHEIGHVFLLEHDDDPANIMHGSRLGRDPNATFDADQIEAVHESAARFTRGCL